MICSKLNYKDTTSLYFATAKEINTSDIDYMRASELKIRLYLIRETDSVLEEACNKLIAAIDAVPHRYVKSKENHGRGTPIKVDEDVVPV